jgi:hypothetical protein
MQPLVKVPVKNGLIAGVLGALLVVGLYYMGNHPFMIPVFADFRIFLFGIFIFFTLKEVRDFHQAGILYFPQGIFASFVFTTAYAIVASALLWIFILLVPDFLTSYIQLKMEDIRSLPPEVIEQIGKDVYNRNLESLPATNGLELASTYLVQSFVLSFFISIILSVILRRQPKT